MKHLKLFEQKSYEEKVAEICHKYNIRNWSINSNGLVDVDGDVNLYGKKLTQLPLSFGYVTGYFSFIGNEITDLDGCPHTVGGNFSCAYNRITSLEGCPNTVGNDFYCYVNELTSLRFAPEEVEGNVYILPSSASAYLNTMYANSNNSISDIPEQYLTSEYLQFIVKEQYDWNLYRKDGSMRFDRLEQMIEWGIETNKIKPL